LAWAAQRWEYRRIGVDLDGDDWVARYSDGDDTRGFDNVLNEWGQRGWELVNVVPWRWDTPNQNGEMMTGQMMVEQTFHEVFRWWGIAHVQDPGVARH
jgi:hypothetical protein